MSRPSQPVSAMSEPPEPVDLSPASTPSPRRGLLAGVDLALRVLGGILAVVAAVLTGVLELLLATLRVGGVLIGVSVLIAVLANVALSWFARRAVGRRWAVALPASVWFALMVLAAGGTAEGDILLAADNWVGLAMITAGSVAFAVMAFRMMVDPRR